jgi:hypothetical protein
MWREAEARAQVLKQEIDQRFPAGTRHANIRNFLQERFGGYAEGGGTLRIGVKNVPNREWLMPCSTWNVGVEMKFESAKLSGTEITSLGIDCL